MSLRTYPIAVHNKERELDVFVFVCVIVLWVIGVEVITKPQVSVP